MNCKVVPVGGANELTQNDLYLNIFMSLYFLAILLYYKHTTKSLIAQNRVSTPKLNISSIIISLCFMCKSVSVLRYLAAKQISLW